MIKSNVTTAFSLHSPPMRCFFVQLVSAGVLRLLQAGVGAFATSAFRGAWLLPAIDNESLALQSGACKARPADLAVDSFCDEKRKRGKDGS